MHLHSDHCATFVQLLLFLLPALRIGSSSAWKPIHGVAPQKDGATSASYKTTSFSLKQSHPDTSSLPSYGAVYSGPKESSGAATELAAQTLSFGHDDADQYNSYGLIDEKQFVFTSSGGGSGSGSGSGGGLIRNQKFFATDGCSVKKFAFNQDGVVQYDNQMSELNQFTICFWMRFTNHSGDHVLLTYADDKEPRQIQLWVSNAKNSSFLSMAIKGQQMYRLNYPLRVRQWHHMCSSWNGKTGEWQVWLKAERIGRGFHNSLVGHKIPANGKLSSGGPSVTGDVSQGLHFEITLVQVYRVALSAGKAHRDHKHHHVHHFDHEGQELLITTKATPTINRPQSMHSQLASGQIPTQVRINLANPLQAAALAQQQTTAGQQQQQQHQAITINTNFVNGQINSGSRLFAQQLLSLPLGPSVIRKPIVAAAAPAPATAATHVQFDMLSNPANVQFIDETETRIQFKRQTAEANANANAKAASTEAVKRRKRRADKNHKKRGLVLLEDGSVVDEGLDADVYKYEGLAEFGGEQFKSELTSKMSLEEAVSSHDREPAEEEVRAVMELCTACDLEPFEGAIVFAWKDVHEHMDNALKGQSVGKCGNF